MNFLFSIITHLLAKDGNAAAEAVVCLALVRVTYIQNKKLKYHKVNPTTEKNTEPKSYIKIA